MHTLAGDEREMARAGPGLREGQWGHCVGQMCLNRCGNSPSGAVLQFLFHSSAYATPLELQRRGIPAGIQAEPSTVLNVQPGKGRIWVNTGSKQNSLLRVFARVWQGFVCVGEDPRGKETAHSWLSTGNSSVRGFFFCFAPH